MQKQTFAFVRMPLGVNVKPPPPCVKQPTKAGKLAVSSWSGAPGTERPSFCCTPSHLHLPPSHADGKMYLQQAFNAQQLNTENLLMVSSLFRKSPGGVSVSLRGIWNKTRQSKI